LTREREKLEIIEQEYAKAKEAEEKAVLEQKKLESRKTVGERKSAQIGISST
jgi:hypothetical protein